MTENQENQKTLNQEPKKMEFQVEEMSHEDLERLYENSISTIREGSVVKGKILSITRDEVMVDIGYKSEESIPIWEFPDTSQLKIGEEIEVYLEATEDPSGTVVLSRTKAERYRRWEDMVENHSEGDIVRGTILRKVRGGMMVDVGVEAFLPASQVDIKHITNMDDFVNRELDFKILQINTERKNIVISRRELLEEERQLNRNKLLEDIEVGQVREGVVKNITDFGAFIDLYGLDGLLHITDMTWGRVNHPSEILKIGDKVKVAVLDFDREKQRISLGLKQTTPNPWDDIDSKYPVGSIVKGIIVNVLPYGAFIELEKGVEGLIHISELSWTKRITSPGEVLSEGQEVEAMVLSIKKDECKISLGIKQTEFNPWSVVEEKYPTGTKVKGKVRNITSYGAFVELEEGIDGLIHISDISWTRKINHPSEVLKKSEIVEALVLNVNQEAKKITLGLKQLEENPWETVKDELRVGAHVEVEVSRVAEFGVFAILPNGIESLVHISQIADKTPENVQSKYSVGDKLTVKVVKIGLDDKKIILSEREYLQDLRRVEQEKKQRERERAAAVARKREDEEEARRLKVPTELGEKIEEAIKSASTPQEEVSEPAPEESEEIAAEQSRPDAGDESLKAEESAIAAAPLEEKSVPEVEAPPEEEPVEAAVSEPEEAGGEIEKILEPASPDVQEAQPPEAAAEEPREGESSTEEEAPELEPVPEAPPEVAVEEPIEETQPKIEEASTDTAVETEKSEEQPQIETVSEEPERIAEETPEAEETSAPTTESETIIDRQEENRESGTAEETETEPQSSSPDEEERPAT